MYEIRYAQSARKALKRLRRNGSFPEERFKELLALFMSGRAIPINFKDHALQGDLAVARECHLGFNLLVEYSRNEYLKVVTIIRVGTHAELFGE